MEENNGDNLISYLKETIKRYEADKNIFDKTINILNIFMQRKDWPTCYNEFVDLTEDLLGANN